MLSSVHILTILTGVGIILTVLPEFNCHKSQVLQGLPNISGFFLWILPSLLSIVCVTWDLCISFSVTDCILIWWYRFSLMSMETTYMNWCQILLLILSNVWMLSILWTAVCASLIRRQWSIEWTSIYSLFIVNKWKS